MNLTAYDIGQRSPADLISRVNRHKGRTPLAAEEKARRHALARQARAQVPSMNALARAVGHPSGAVSQWLNGRRPVPARHIPALERIAGGDV